MKKILPLIIVLLLFGGLVAAIPSPEPVSGQIKVPGYPEPEGLKVVQKNLRTNLEYETVVDANGFYLLDWGNLPHLSGDKVEVAVKVCKDKAECKRVVELAGEPVAGLDLVVPASAEQVVVSEVQYKYVCADKSIKDKSEDCPSAQVQQVIVPSKVLVCKDGTEVANADDCPSDPLLLLSLSVSALLVVAGGALLKYKWGKGFLGVAAKLKQKGDDAAKKGDKVLAEKYYKQAAKRLATVIEKDQKGLYKK